MRFTFPLPEQFDHRALAAHIRAAGVPGFTDSVSSDTDLHIDLQGFEDTPEERVEEFRAELEPLVRAAVTTYVYQAPAGAYREKRIAAYEERIPVGDQLDALRKGIDSPEWQAVVATAEAIKTEFPKE